MHNPKFQVPIIVASSIVLVLMLLFTGVSRIAGAEATGGLFVENFTTGSIDKENQPQILRSRFVDINFDLLETGDFSPASEHNTADLLVLNLFEDTEFTAVLKRIERVSPESYSWIGSIEEIEFGSVILTIGGGMIAGSITLPGEFYQVGYAGNGVHAIYEIDQSQFDPCGGGIAPDRSARAGVPAKLPEEQELHYMSSADDGSVIDIMVVYTEEARQAMGGTTAIHNEIDSAISYSNTIYENSQINQRLNLVHKEEIVYAETGDGFEALTRLSAPSDGYMDNVHTLRSMYLADCVVLIIRNFPFYCGVAWVMSTVSHGFEDSAFSVVKDTCLNTATFPHELGHNMGARHDWYVDSTNNRPFTYNHGFVNIMPEQDLGIRTVMAYRTECTDSGITNCSRVPYFSNPDVLAYDLYQIGIPEGSYYAADNRKTLNNTAYTVANFRTPEDCYDGIDNDGDGLTDCYDDECFAYNPDEVCDDGLDNDCDELVDCADPECDGFIVPCITGDPGVCTEGTGLCLEGDISECVPTVDPADEVCDDDLDNDCDGLIDLEDADCSNHQPFYIPDTGQTKCYNDVEEIICPQPGEVYYGQDVQYCQYPQSYSKLDQGGIELDDSATSWIMVKDDLNGLIWEGKTEDGSIHDGTNGGSWDYAIGTFIDELNVEEFGGFSDWRLPLIKEMTLIVNKEDPPSLGDFFPNTGDRFYWSSNTYTDENKYVVYFWDGDVSFKWPAFSHAMRGVRGIPPSQNFVPNGDGTVTDTSTNLMWEVKTDDGGMRDKDNTYLWKDALSYCENLTHAGYDDWRLPNINELISLVHYSADKPKINTSLFPNTQPDDYWSSTTYHRSPGWSWKAAFSQGYVKATQKYIIRNYVRAVRGGLSAVDYDCDIVPNDLDNCYAIYNPGQEDNDGDSAGNACDNCPDHYNPNLEDADDDGIGDVCDPCPDDPENDADLDTVCGDTDNCPNSPNPGQEDTLPSGGNGIGDACDCEGNFDCDEDTDGTDAAAFKADFGRSSFLNPCTNGDQCQGDFDCDVDVDGTDAALFKQDFGRSSFSNPCPACEVGDWCVYPE